MNPKHVLDQTLNTEPYEHARQTLMLANDVLIDQDKEGMRALALYPRYHPNPRTLSKSTAFECENYWDVLTGKSWYRSAMDGNPAALQYAFRTKGAKLPLDNQVVYGQINGFGYMLHVTELTA